VQDRVGVGELEDAIDEPLLEGHLVVGLQRHLQLACEFNQKKTGMISML
jgi:hypothetical protein